MTFESANLFLIQTQIVSRLPLNALILSMFPFFVKEKIIKSLEVLEVIWKQLF
jgi:hypothetical protein